MKILVPCPGRTVLCPDSKRIVGPDGIKVNMITTYWHRRIQSGDVVEKEPEISPVPEQKKLKPIQPKADKPVQDSEKEEK